MSLKPLKVKVGEPYERTKDMRATLPFHDNYLLDGAGTAIASSTHDSHADASSTWRRAMQMRCATPTWLKQSATTAMESSIQRDIHKSCG